MAKQVFEFEYEQYDDIEELSMSDAALLHKARKVALNAYAPYSHFYVGAAAQLTNNEVVTGTNQENASYPVGICAERSLLSTAATLFPEVPVETMAISYVNKAVDDYDYRPISPCGMCRQALLEYENRTTHPIRFILSGQDGPVIIVNSVKKLLPFSFDGNSLK